MATIADLKGTSCKSFTIGNGATIIQSDEEPRDYIGKIGDIYICTDTGILYIKNQKDGYENGIWESYKTYYFDDPIINDIVSESGKDHTITIQQASAPTGAGISDQSVTTDVITGDYHDNYGVIRFATENEATLGKLRNVAISPATLATVSQNAIVYRGIWGVEQAVTTYAFFETQRQAQPTGILKAGSLYFVGGLPTSTNPSYYSGSFNTPAVGSEYVLTIVEPSGNKTYNTGINRTTDQSVDDDNLAHWCSEHYLQFISTADVRERPWCKIGDTVYEYGDHVIFAEDWDGTTPITTDILNKFDNTESTDIVRLNAHQTLTNKNIDADTNVIQNIRVTRTGAQQAGLSTYTTNFADGVVRQAIRDFANSSHDSLATEKSIRIELDNKPNAVDGDLTVGNFLKLKQIQTDANNHNVIVGEWVDYIPDIPLFKYDLFDHVPENTGWVFANQNDPLPLDGTEYISAYDLLERNYVGQNYTYAKTFSIVLYKWMTTNNESVYTTTSNPDVQNPDDIEVYSYNDVTKEFTLLNDYIETHYNDGTDDYIRLHNDSSKIFNNQNSATSGTYSISITYKCNLTADTKSGYRICSISEKEKLNRLYRLTGSAWFYQIDTEHKTFNLPRGTNYLKADSTKPIDNGGTTPGYGDFVSAQFGDVWVAGENVEGGMSYNKFGLYFYLGNTILYDTTIDLRDILTTLQNKENLLVPGDSSIRLERVGNQTKIYATTGGGGGGSAYYDDLLNKPQINNVTLVGNKSANDLNLYTQTEINSFLNAKANTADLGTAASADIQNNLNNAVAGEVADALAVKNALDLKANIADLGSMASENVTDFYTKTQIDSKGYQTATDVGNLIDTSVSSGSIKTALDGKANVATTLAGYGITDAYTKSEINASLLLKEDISNKTNTLDSSSTITQYPNAKLVYDNIKVLRNKIEEVEDLNSTSITLSNANENTVYKYGDLTSLTIQNFDISNYETVIYFHSLENFISCEVTTNPAGTTYYARKSNIENGEVIAGASVYTDVGCSVLYESEVSANTYFATGSETQQQSGGSLSLPANVAHIGLIPEYLNNAYYRLTIKNGIFELEEYAVGQTVTIIANDNSVISINIT